ncbi:hypothetical protein EV146_109286 [Mesobacillus foraminis]|uniref:DUF3892 domain-containing protein n=2 Tax=Mesobacillus foraminis TaxID=279826 RepID=A0A4R2B9A7_9BACI|nr:hypothetical protein EV146_109286 [Mesobacillus foraminis]
MIDVMREQLVAVYKNHAGDVISFQTSGGRIISYRKALQEAEEGTITGINIQENAAEGDTLHGSFESQSISALPEYY